MNDSGSSPEACSSNRRHELASATPKKCAGRRIFKETRHPVYRGVRRRNNNKWVCEVRVPNDKTTRVWLGTHSTPEMAARAHDVAALALRRESACLNFADSAWRIPPLLPASNSPKELRRVAMDVAQEFAVEDQFQQHQTNYNANNNNNNFNNNNDDNNKVVEVDQEQVHEDWLRSMEDEPLRSPPYIPLFEGSYGGHYGTSEWITDDVDPEVSLWSFSI